MTVADGDPVFGDTSVVVELSTTSTDEASNATECPDTTTVGEPAVMVVLPTTTSAGRVVGDAGSSAPPDEDGVGVDVGANKLLKSGLSSCPGFLGSSGLGAGAGSRARCEAAGAKGCGVDGENPGSMMGGSSWGMIGKISRGCGLGLGERFEREGEMGLSGGGEAIA